MIELKTNISLEEAIDLVDQLNSHIRTEEDRLNKEAQEYYSNEYFSEEYYSQLFTKVQKIFKYINRNDYPEDGKCSHHGIDFNFHDEYLKFLSFENKLLIILDMNDKQYLHNRKKVSFSIKDHEKRIEVISQAIGSPLFKTWNGVDGSTQVSAVFDIDCPKSIINSIENSRKDNISKPRDDKYAKFQNWLKGVKKD